MKGHKDYEAARIEALQEAGLVGKVRKKPIGSFQFWKRLETSFELMEAVVYIVDVASSVADWKERAERQIQWMGLDDAAFVVDEPGLASILQSYQAKAASKVQKKIPPVG